MTQEEIIKHLHEALNSVDITFPYRYVLVEAIEALSQPSLPDGLEEAAEKHTFYASSMAGMDWETHDVTDAFKAGAEWMKAKMMEEAVEFECIGKKVKMTIQELINYYIDQECCDVADECGF